MHQSGSRLEHLARRTSAGAEKVAAAVMWWGRWRPCAGDVGPLRRDRGDQFAACADGMGAWPVQDAVMRRRSPCQRGCRRGWYLARRRSEELGASSSQSEEDALLLDQAPVNREVVNREMVNLRWSPMATSTQEAVYPHLDSSGAGPLVPPA